MDTHPFIWSIPIYNVVFELMINSFTVLSANGTVRNPSCQGLIGHSTFHSGLAGNALANGTLLARRHAKTIQSCENSHVPWSNHQFCWVIPSYSLDKSPFLWVFLVLPRIEKKRPGRIRCGWGPPPGQRAPPGWRCCALARRVQRRSSGNRPPDEGFHRIGPPRPDDAWTVD